MTTPKEEFDAIRRRILEAERRLAEIRRAFLVDGKGTSQAVRAEIEYELADLRLRRHDCKRRLIELKEAATAFKRSNMLIVLIEKVKGSPVSTKVLGYSQVVGLVFVLLLVLFVTYVVGLGSRAVADGATGLLGDFNRHLDKDARYPAGPDEAAPFNLVQAWSDGVPRGATLLRATDMGGTAQWGTGSSPAAGTQVRVTFTSAYTNPPTVILSPANAATAALHPFVTQVTIGYMDIQVAIAPAATQPADTYAVNWVAFDN